MRVYEDFLTYKTGEFHRANSINSFVFVSFFNFSFFFFLGVYHHVTGNYLGMLSVRMIGWGIEREHAYWLLANSWGTSWGIKGFFKIRRFVNECWIENFRYAGIPKL